MSRTDRHSARHHSSSSATTAVSRLDVDAMGGLSNSSSMGSTGSGSSSSGDGMAVALREALPVDVGGGGGGSVPPASGGGDGGGYDYEFVPAADSRFMCPICMMVMRRPVQTPCGHRFCGSCIAHWIREKASSDCPTCKSRLAENQIFPDNYACREIMSLTVKCSNAKDGCTAVVELGNFQMHLNSDCQFTLCRCPNRCNAVLLKKDIELHMKTACQSRKLLCKLCNESFPVHDKEVHLKTCPKMLDVCSLCGKKMPRFSIKEHQDSDCPLKVVYCLFRQFGCDHQGPKDKVALHMNNENILHLRLLGDELLKLKKQICLPQNSNASYLGALGWSSDSSNIVALEVTDYDHGVNDQNVLTPATMTTETGFASGLNAGTMTTDRGFVSGPFPNALTASSWTGLPLMSPRVAPPLAMSEPIFNKSTRERELERIVSKLQKVVSEQASRISFLEQRLGDMDELVARQNIGSYVWQITEVSRRRNDAMQGSSSATLHSPCFYTSATGYKLCLRVNLNGVDTGVNNFLAIFVHVNRGAFDSILDWPFSGIITLRVLDQTDVASSARQHIVENLEAKPGLAAFLRPQAARNHRGFGFIEFAPLHVLDDSRYVRNDTLIIHAIARESPLSSRT